MNAEIIAIGSELLTPSRIDTNSLFLTERLNEIGVVVQAKTIVGDDRVRVASALREALRRSDLIVLTGGLGPTDDDVTREAVVDVLGVPLDEDAAIVERLRQRFARRGFQMPDVNRRQAQVPRGGTVLENPLGTAPGLLLEHGGKRIVLLPGPPRELQPMFETLVRDRLTAIAGAGRLFRRILRVVGRGESHVEEVAQPIYSRWRDEALPIETTILAAPGQIELHLTVSADDAEGASRRLDDATEALTAAIGPDLFSADGRSMEEIVGDLLRERSWRIGIGESCTGGLIASRLTDVAGSSDYVIGSVVCYSNDAKINLLGVPAASIEEHGAVSEPVAIAMAVGARRVFAADVGVSATGIAGPGGGSERKPVGTVCVAVVDPAGNPHVRTASLFGNRQMIKFQAAQAALDFVRRVLPNS